MGNPSGRLPKPSETDCTYPENQSQKTTNKLSRIFNFIGQSKQGNSHQNLTNKINNHISFSSKAKTFSSTFKENQKNRESIPHYLLNTEASLRRCAPDDNYDSRKRIYGRTRKRVRGSVEGGGWVSTSSDPHNQNNNNTNTAFLTQSMLRYQKLCQNMFPNQTPGQRQSITQYPTKNQIQNRQVNQRQNENQHQNKHRKHTKKQQSQTLDQNVCADSKKKYPLIIYSTNYEGQGKKGQACEKFLSLKSTEETDEENNNTENDNDNSNNGAINKASNIRDRIQTLHETPFNTPDDGNHTETDECSDFDVEFDSDSYSDFFCNSRGRELDRRRSEQCEKEKEKEKVTGKRKAAWNVAQSASRTSASVSRSRSRSRLSMTISVSPKMSDATVSKFKHSTEAAKVFRPAKKPRWTDNEIIRAQTTFETPLQTPFTTPKHSKCTFHFPCQLQTCNNSENSGLTSKSYASEQKSSQSQNCLLNQNQNQNSRVGKSSWEETKEKCKTKSSHMLLSQSEFISGNVLNSDSKPCRWDAAVGVGANFGSSKNKNSNRIMMSAAVSVHDGILKERHKKQEKARVKLKPPPTPSFNLLNRLHDAFYETNCRRATIQSKTLAMNRLQVKEERGFEVGKLWKPAEKHKFSFDIDEPAIMKSNSNTNVDSRINSLLLKSNRKRLIHSLERSPVKTLKTVDDQERSRIDCSCSTQHFQHSKEISDFNSFSFKTPLSEKDAFNQGTDSKANAEERSPVKFSSNYKNKNIQDHKPEVSKPVSINKCVTFKESKVSMQLIRDSLRRESVAVTNLQTLLSPSTPELELTSKSTSSVHSNSSDPIEETDTSRTSWEFCSSRSASSIKSSRVINPDFQSFLPPRKSMSVYDCKINITNKSETDLDKEHDQSRFDDKNQAKNLYQLEDENGNPNINFNFLLKPKPKCSKDEVDKDKWGLNFGGTDEEFQVMNFCCNPRRCCNIMCCPRSPAQCCCPCPGPRLCPRPCPPCLFSCTPSNHLTGCCCSKSCCQPACCQCSCPCPPPRQCQCPPPCCQSQPRQCPCGSYPCQSTRGCGQPPPRPPKPPIWGPPLPPKSDFPPPSCSPPFDPHPPPQSHQYYPPPPGGHYPPPPSDPCYSPPYNPYGPPPYDPCCPPPCCPRCPPPNSSSSYYPSASPPPSSSSYYPSASPPPSPSSYYPSASPPPTPPGCGAGHQPRYYAGQRGQCQCQGQPQPQYNYQRGNHAQHGYEHGNHPQYSYQHGNHAQYGNQNGSHGQYGSQHGNRPQYGYQQNNQAARYRAPPPAPASVPQPSFYPSQAPPPCAYAYPLYPNSTPQSGQC